MDEISGAANLEEGATAGVGKFEGSAANEGKAVAGCKAALLLLPLVGLVPPLVPDPDEPDPEELGTSDCSSE